jgi:S1-C subfamily serine protease
MQGQAEPRGAFFVNILWRPGPKTIIFDENCPRMNLSRLALLPALLAGLAALPCPASAKPANANLALARQLDQAFAEVAERVSSAVVVISVVQRAAPDPGTSDEGFEALPPGFWREFHRHFRQPETAQGEGSGVIIRQDGYIVTNGHVVEDAESIEVRLRDGRRFQATLRGFDPQSDLAVIKIDAKNLPTAAFGDSAKARVGQYAIAIGAPFSFEYSVTFGHVSAKGRSNVIHGYEASAMDQDFIQTDANINPGNSGGPLVNIDGEVIGINTLIEGFHSGVGFAISSNLAREITDELIAHGKAARAWLGLEVRGLREDPDFRDLVHGVDDGVIVRAILRDGPAAKSGLNPGDVITAVDGQAVATSQQLRTAIRGKPAGRPVCLDIRRSDASGGAARLTVKLSPGEWVQTTPVPATQPSNPSTNTVPARLGLTVRALTSDLAAEFGFDSLEGVLVLAVEKDAPASGHNIKPGDIITAINQQPIATPIEFSNALEKSDLRRGVILTLTNSRATRLEIIRQTEP